LPRGHCLDYWHKWQREYNFCGLRDQDAKDNNRYLELVDKIAESSAGLEGDFILEHFTAGAARPLLRCKDGMASVKGLNYVVACLKRGEDVTGGDLAATINVFLGKKEKPPENTQMRTELTNVNSPCGEKCLDCPDQCKPITLEELEKAAAHPAIITDTFKKVSSEYDTVPTAPLAQTLKEKYGGQEQHIGNGPDVSINPVFVPDTLREEPNRKADLDRCADALMDLMPKGTQLTITDQMRLHPSWKVKDVWYYGIEALAGRWK